MMDTVPSAETAGSASTVHAPVRALRPSMFYLIVALVFRQRSDE